MGGGQGGIARFTTCQVVAFENLELHGLTFLRAKRLKIGDREREDLALPFAMK